MDILGIKISNLTQSETLSRARSFLIDGKQHLIFTPNPEMLVDAQSDWFFKTALNKADLTPADGFGLVLAARYLYNTFLNRFPGVELMEKICELAAQKSKSIYLVGGERGVAELAAGALLKKYPGLKIAGAEEGITFKSQILNLKSQNFRYLVGINFDQETNQELLNRIQKAAPDVLFVAFGHPKQEKWLAEFTSELPSVKIGMGVGGSFDYISDKISRAPQFVRRLGLEWFWRFLRQPFRRFIRIWKAVVIFSLSVWIYKKQLSLPYRPGVIGFIINKEKKIFIAKRRHDWKTLDFHQFNFNHWQPPQGGIDGGETAEEAVIREVKEETGMATSILAKCPTPIQYAWNDDLKDLFGRILKRRIKYRGSNKWIFLLQYNGDGSDIKLDNRELEDYKWLTLEELKQIIHPYRQKSLDILIKECLTEKPN